MLIFKKLIVSGVFQLADSLLSGQILTISLNCIKFGDDELYWFDTESLKIKNHVHSGRFQYFCLQKFYLNSISIIPPPHPLQSLSTQINNKLSKFSLLSFLLYPIFPSNVGVLLYARR